MSTAPPLRRCASPARLYLTLAFAALVGCSSAPADPCTSLCDGIARCRDGNAQCVAMGMTAHEPFITDCIAQCEDTASTLTSSERETALDCLACLEGQTNFGECNGEVLLDETCATTCRSGGAIPFRNDFGPALFGDFGCVANPRP